MAVASASPRLPSHRPRPARAGLAAALAALAVVAPAAADEGAASAALQRVFGATLVSTYEDGRTALLWIHPDGTYSAKGRRRKPSSGVWKLKGSRICLKQARPKSIPFSFCTPLPQGEMWPAKTPKGQAVTVRIVPGAGEPSV